MSEFNLSVVLLIPDAHKAAINELAELAGYGPDNLSVQLDGPSGSIWWGGHTWAKPEFLAELGASEPTPALAALVMSVREGADPLAHWNEALAANNLIRPEVEL